MSERLTDDDLRDLLSQWRSEPPVFEAIGECLALRARVARLEAALEEAGAVFSIVEPRSDKAEYLRVLGVVRTALGEPPR